MSSGLIINRHKYVMDEITGLAGFAIGLSPEKTLQISRARI
jgi:hypothetical protein